MIIDKYHISPAHKPFIIAEMSGNHNRSLAKALRLVEAAASAGVDAIKLQTYTADTLTIDAKRPDFVIDDPKSLWHGRTLYDLYTEAHTPWEWHAPLLARAKELGILLFSTPFDSSAVDFLEELHVPCYKIASFENSDLELLKKVAHTGKPVIISSGMATIAELDESVRTLREHGCPDIALLKCTSSYPASPENCNIVTIEHMRELFDCNVGLSDHTLGIGVAIAAVARGATIIEKHMTLSRAEGGVDAAFSLEPPEMSALIKECKNAWLSLGKIKYGPTEQETGSKKFRRSLYIVEDMVAGTTLSEKNLRSIRPGYGIPPRYLSFLYGKRVNSDIERGTPFSWNMIG